MPSCPRQPAEPSGTPSGTVKRRCCRRCTDASRSRLPRRRLPHVAREMLDKSDNERSGVLSTAMACLGPYRDPVIARNTSASDFRIADLMNADRPASLYLVVPPSDLARTRPIIRLMLNQIGGGSPSRCSSRGRPPTASPPLAPARRVPIARAPRLLRERARVPGRVRDEGLPDRPVFEPARERPTARITPSSTNCHVHLTYAANDCQ